MLEQIRWRYGEILAPSSDQVITRSLRLYGEWAEHEITLLSSFVRPQTVVLDIGAFIGTHTIALATRDRSIDVIGIEAQPKIAAALSVNLEKSHLPNVYSLLAVCGSKSGLAKIPKTENNANPGATTIQASAHTGIRNLWPLRVRSNEQIVPFLALDSLILSAPISLIKIDVEGMEEQVIRGARKQIARFRPTVAFEVIDTRKASGVLKAFRGLEYSFYWMETSQFNRNNFNKNSENIWWRTEMSILCIPREAPQLGYPPVTMMPNVVPSKMDARVGIELP